MNLSFYTAAIGAQQQQNRMDVHANNIANVNTNGFRGQQTVFSSLVYDMMNGVQSDSLPRGTGAKLSATTTNFTSSGYAQTGLTYDFAIEGDGFFVLLDPATREYSYTRDGAFTMASFTEVRGLDGDWYLSDGNGRLVIGSDNQPMQIELEDYDTENDDNNNNNDDDKDEDPITVGIFNVANRGKLIHDGGGRFTLAEREPLKLSETAKLMQGYLESSNTDLATEMVKIIEAQRSFSYALKMVQTSDEIETTVNNLR